MLATLYNVFRDDIGMAQFSFANADLHNRINEAISSQYSVGLPYYVLDPIPKKGVQNWLRRHQDVHNQMNAVLGIVGNDLSAVDFTNLDQVAAWIWLHAQEHYQASNKLGLQ